MKILILDNYDSFTYNLVHLVEKLINTNVFVIKNDKIDLNSINQYDKIILSPGPGIPDEAGKLKLLIEKTYKSKPILGVCLGQQAIAEVFGAKLENLPKVFHGVDSDIFVLENEKLFNEMPKIFKAGRYHSWAVSKNKFPDCLKILAEDKNKIIMALKHKEFPVYGVQFHPESILTPDGEQIINNWLKI